MEPFKLGEVNSGRELDKIRAPQGFIFLSNTDPEKDIRMKSYLENPDKYQILRDAYTENGTLIPGNVAIFRKLEEVKS